MHNPSPLHPPTQPQGNIFVVDDDDDLLSSVCRLLTRNGYHVTPFSSPLELIEKFPEIQPDCVVTDVMMDEMDGFSLAQSLRRSYPATGLVFMTAWPKISDAILALKSYGGTNYLEKPMSSDAVLEAVADAVAWSIPRKQALDKISLLSKREREVLLLLSKGFSNKKMAFHLKLSEKTIEFHRSIMMKKIGISDIPAVVEIARSIEDLL